MMESPTPNQDIDLTDKSDHINASDVVLDMNLSPSSDAPNNESADLTTPNHLHVDSYDANTEDVDDDEFNPSFTVITSPTNKSKRGLSPKQLTPQGSDSFGSSFGGGGSTVSDMSHDTLDTFNSSMNSNMSFDSPKHAAMESPRNGGHVSPSKNRGLGTILREDSFDRQKYSYKMTYKATSKMDRAKILGVNQYTFLRTLGKGAFAEVKLGTKSKLENDDVVRDLDVDDFERYAIKIIKKNFMQDKRKLQTAASNRNVTPKARLTPTVSFKSTLSDDVRAEAGGGEGKGKGGAEEPKKAMVATPPRATGRSLRMKNKKFQPASAIASVTTATPTSTTTPRVENGAVTTSSVVVTAPLPAINVPPPPPPEQALPQSQASVLEGGIASSHSSSNGSVVCASDTTTPQRKASLTEASTETATTPPLPQFSPKHPEPSPVAEEVLQEIEILKYLQHKNLVKLCEIIDDPTSKHLYIIMEYVPAGPIMIRESANGNFISRLTGGVLLESMASKIFKDLMSVLEYLHINHIAHRDLKPDNLLVDYNGTLKVSDFGVSNHFSDEKRKKAVNMRQLSRSKSRGVVNSTEGTFAFYSPEMCRENSGAYSAYMSDVWAASVCLWIFVFGTLPFYSADIVDLFSMIRLHNPVMPHRVSPELAHLLEKILQKDQDQRLSIHDIQNHCWLKRCPLKGNGISSDDFETDDDLDTNLDDMTSLFSPRVYASLKRWVDIARNKCVLRSQKFVQDMESELVTMLRRSSIAFKNQDGQSEDGGDSSDDDDPLARMVSYDEIGGSVLEDIKKHEERQAAVKLMTSVVEGDEGKSPVRLTPPKAKKALRVGRKSRLALNSGGGFGGPDDVVRSSTSSMVSSEGSTPTLDMHERLTQEAIVALELETFTLQTNKQLKDEEKAAPKGPKSCCSVS